MLNPIQNRPNVNRTEEVRDRSQPQSGREVTSPFSKTLGRVKNEGVKREIFSQVMTSSQKYNLPPELVLAVIKQESGFKPNATSHCDAAGLMQLMPETACEMGVTNRYDIGQNIDGGCRYLREMLDRFDGKVDLALAAYNAGPGNVEKYGGIPPFEETQNYVESIQAHMKEFGDLPDLRIATDQLFQTIDLDRFPNIVKENLVEDPTEFSRLRRRV